LIAPLAQCKPDGRRFAAASPRPQTRQTRHSQRRAFGLRAPGSPESVAQWRGRSLRFSFACASAPAGSRHATGGHAVKKERPKVTTRFLTTTQADLAATCPIKSITLAPPITLIPFFFFSFFKYIHTTLIKKEMIIQNVWCASIYFGQIISFFQDDSFFFFQLMYPVSELL
jgi:hypothetical protein